MKEALKEAKKAYDLGEVPVGAVIVKDGKIIARGYNMRECKQNALSHAETEAINNACKELGSWRLTDCDIYVTLEPCAMCCGAIAQAKVRRLYFGAYDKKGGFAVSNAELIKNPSMQHNMECYCGIMEEECGELLRRFFSKMR